VRVKESEVFHCTQCGECCRHVDNSELTSHLDRGDGLCRYLDRDERTCTIYGDRPLVCRVDECFDQVFRHSMSRAEYYRRNAAACNEMQEEAGLPVRYRVRLEEEELDEPQPGDKM
jgi:Fe-S-cluster containining protein